MTIIFSRKNKFKKSDNFYQKCLNCEQLCEKKFDDFEENKKLH